MFTGIIEEKGKVLAVEKLSDSMRITIGAELVLSDVRHGDSLAVDGVCLTVVEHSSTAFTAAVMQQTLRMSTLGELKPGKEVNLERATRVGDRLGGHIVQGHSDGISTVIGIKPGADWRVVRCELEENLAARVVDKGSITLSGVSLTVSDVSEPHEKMHWFEVSLIPETLSATTLGALTVGDTVNIETDILAKHVERMLRLRGSS